MTVQLRYYGDPVLRKKCRKVEEITDDVRALVEQMVRIMDSVNGAGLAAPQVGQDLCIFVARTYAMNGDALSIQRSDPKVFVNPEMLSYSEETNEAAEACLSIPQLWLPVRRSTKIVIEATDLMSHRFCEDLQDRNEAERLNARVRQHEFDHLLGVLFVDRLEADVKLKAEPALQEIQRRYASL